MTSEARNALEQLLDGGRQGRVPMDDVLSGLLGGALVVPSGAEVGENFAGFVPVLFHRESVPMLAVFTDQSRAATVTHLARYALSMTGRDLVAMMPADHGIVVNPGHDLGLELLPDAVDSLRRSAAGPA